jgi:hypothetical protein
MSTDIEGVAGAIKLLRKIEPEYRKEFNKGMREVVAPVLSEVKAGYPALPASGMARAWNPKGYAIFPWDRAKVAPGRKAKDLYAARPVVRSLHQPGRACRCSL